MASAIRFFVHGEAQPKGSTRAFVVGWKPGQVTRPKTVTTTDNPQLKAWEKHIQDVATDYAETVDEGPMSVRLLFSLMRPKSVSVSERPLPTVDPDIDKLSRAVLDAMSGVCYADDQQVIRLVARKEYVSTPSKAGVLIECSTFNNPQE